MINDGFCLAGGEADARKGRARLEPGGLAAEPRVNQRHCRDAREGQRDREHLRGSSVAGG